MKKMFIGIACFVAFGISFMSFAVETKACCGSTESYNATADVTQLWPPNHKFVDIGITAFVTDEYGNTTTTDNWYITNVTVTDYVDEGDKANGSGGKKHDPAFIFTGQNLMLRAERCGNSGGREYVVTLTIVGSTGSGSGQVTITVPHDKGNDSE